MNVPSAEEKWLRAGVNIVVDTILAMLQEDNHHWSTRPCQTCKSIGAIIGKPFGCYVHAERRKNQ